MNTNNKIGMACLLAGIFSLGWTFGQPSTNACMALATTTLACLCWTAWQLSEATAKIVLCYGLVVGVFASAIAGFIG
jgi:hypothetical protein